MKPRSRRLAWLLPVFVVTGALLGIYGIAIEPNRLVLHREHLALSGWHGPALRIAAISDLHFGSLFMTPAKARAIVDRINGESVDLVVLLGDYVVGYGERPSAAVFESLGEFGRLRSRLGTFAVLGNHDCQSDTAGISEVLTRSGIRILDNEAIPIDHGAFWLWGIADLWERSPDYTVSRKSIPPEAPVLALAHNPDVFPAVPHGVALTLAGHTHGGQVKFPLVGSPIVPSSFGQRYAAGRVHEAEHDLFVTTGIGTSIIPVRFGVPPEIVVLELSGATSSGYVRTQQ